MPSYRVRLVIGLVRSGVDPADVLPTAVAAARERTTVEASQVQVVRGEAQVVVRFEAADDVDAGSVGRAVVAAVDGVAEVHGHRVTRRFGNRWHPLR